VRFWFSLTVALFLFPLLFLSYTSQGNAFVVENLVLSDQSWWKQKKEKIEEPQAGS